MEDPKLIDKWFSRLPPAARAAANTLISLAQDSGSPLYLVGGPLRDLLLGRPSLDIDFVLEGDAPTLARHLADRLGGRLIVHPRFATATIHLDAFTLDIATARAEVYPRPGALPVVRPASIREDLARRDFTINAIALRLTTPHRGALIDPFNGRQDLQAGLIRSLHPASFADDPTRIFRAARYAFRLGFQVEDDTHRQIKAALPHLCSISAARIHEEVSRTLREETPEGALLHLQDWGALAAIHPALTFDQTRATAFSDLRRLSAAATPAAYWPLLAWTVPESEVPSLRQRLALTRSQAQSIALTPRIRWLETGLVWQALRPSELVAALDPYPLPTLWAFAVMAQGPARERIIDYLRRLRHIRPALRGTDLETLGVPRGPVLGEVLRRLRVAKLDGVVKTRQDEVRFALSLKPQTHTGGS